MLEWIGTGLFIVMILFELGWFLFLAGQCYPVIKHDERVWQAQTTVKVIMVEHEYRMVSIPERLDRLTEKILRLDDDSLRAIAEFQIPRIEKNLEQIAPLPDIGEMAEQLITSTTDELEEIRLRYGKNIQKLLEVGVVLIYSLENQVAAVEAKQKGLVLVGRTSEGVFISDIPEDMRGLELTPEAINAYFEKHPIGSK